MRIFCLSIYRKKCKSVCTNEIKLFCNILTIYHVLGQIRIVDWITFLTCICFVFGTMEIFTGFTNDCVFVLCSVVLLFFFKHIICHNPDIFFLIDRTCWLIVYHLMSFISLIVQSYVPKSAVLPPAFPCFSMWSGSKSFCVRMAANLVSNFSRPELWGKTVRASAEEDEPGTAKVVEAIARNCSGKTRLRKVDCWNLSKPAPKSCPPACSSQARANLSSNHICPKSQKPILPNSTGGSEQVTVRREC